MKFFDIFKKSNDKYSLYKSAGTTGNFNITPTRALTINEISLYLNRGINKRGEKVGQVQFQLFKGDKEITNHWVLDLLSRPNDLQTGEQFWKLASIYKDVCGFALIKKVSNGAVFKDNQKVSSLELLNPMGATMVLNAEKTKIKSFNYTDINSGISEEIMLDDLIYWYNPNPKNHLEGISLLTAGMRSIDTENQLIEYHNKIIRNGGVVDGVFSFKTSLTKEQLKTLKENYKDEYASSSKAGLPLFLGGDAQYNKVGQSVTELAYLDSRKMFIDDMVAITGVPLPILGITDGQTFSNADTAHRIFLRETIKPILQDLVNTLDWRLVPADLDLKFIDPTPEDTDTKMKVLETADKVNALTINEKREMLGYDPIKNGDDILIPFNKVPQQKSNKIFSHPLRNKAFRHQYHKSYVKQLETRSARFKRELNKYFEDQKKRLLQNLTGRKQFKTKGLFDEVFNYNLEVNLALNLSTFLKDLVRESGQETMDLFMQGQDFVYSETIDSELDKQVQYFAESINDTTAKELRGVFSEWFSNDETLSDLVKRIDESYGGIESWRAETIANTETAKAMQSAKMESYNQMGIPTKVWSWAPGIKGGVRDDHASMDGEEVPMNTPFSNGMDRPLDPNADASEVINCNCSI
jgi:HK97 family phage portal protein